MAWVAGIGLGLVLLFMFPKQVGLLALAIAAIGGATFAYMWAESKIDESERLKIIVTVEYNTVRCAPERPIYIVFRNSNDKTLTRMSFVLEGYRPGYSSSVSDDLLFSDKIIEPLKGYGGCWMFDQPTYKDPIDAPSLDWRVRLTSATWE
ncbi:hypothetical protein ACFFTN_01225 [Aminobacter aganoensis]|uniref:Uncharacterized protein n=1 Tax=Aminobacter aganoensis TaxID=83264 RepID=A0A7X0KJZ1_9HYPH|nr:hypothetical protein [Aminobacter aganoensis]MBB6353520.1 hypothetical protein [Aminobacter aganoensis]